MEKAKNDAIDKTLTKYFLHKAQIIIDIRNTFSEKAAFFHPF